MTEPPEARRGYDERIAAEISTLYELSLSVGQSLDLIENCERFLNSLLARRDLGFAAVWLRRDVLPPSRVPGSCPDEDGALVLVHATPRFRVDDEVLSSDAALATLLSQTDAASFGSDDERFHELINERGIIRGALLLYRIRNLGVLKLLSLSRTRAFDDVQINYLRNVVDKFAVSVAGSLAHEWVVHEIAEREEAKRAQLQSEGRLQAILDNAPAVIFLKDRAGRYLLGNHELARLSGLSIEETQGRTDFDLFPLDLASQIIDADRRVMATGETVRVNETFFVHDEKRHFLTVRFPTYGPDGEVDGVCGVSLDRTEHLRAEENQKRLENAMQRTQKLESLGVLAGGIAHDFNNLLTAMLGNASLALADLDKAPAALSPLRRNIEQIITAATRAAELTDQMLAYSGKGRFVLQAVQLSALVREIAGLLSTVITKKARLRLRLAEDLPTFQGDAAQIRQVVMNLIINASDALAGEEGEITVETRVIHAGRDTHGRTYLRETLSEGDYVSLTVSDTGVGMGEAVRERIFDPFFTTKFTGRGLGLAAVLGIVRGHDGAIDVESEEGRGTTMRVLFPTGRRAVPVSVSAKPPPRAVAVGPQPPIRGTVLIVDDDATVRNVAQLMLQRLGLTVLTANDGQEGVDVFDRRADDIDLVMLDLTMPRLSGEEAYRVMKQRRSDVPVILASGYSETEAMERFGGTGVAGFIKKPFLPTALSAVVRRALKIS